MFCKWLGSSIFSAVLLIAPSTAISQTTLPHGSHVEGELLISPRAGVSDVDLEGTYQGHGGRKLRALSQVNVHHIQVPAHALEAIERALRNNPKVSFVEKNFVAQANLAPNDPNYPNQWHLPKVSAPAAWDLTTGSSSVTVAVIDSGVDPAHPDLAGKLVGGYNYLGGSTSDTYDVLGHGTAVAGVIGADTNNSNGVAGLGWNTTIMPLVVVSSSNYATYADIASAMNYAADHGAKVISMSLGGTSYSSTLQSAVDYAWSRGLVVVAAAGNNSSSAGFYPAALNNVVAVSATDGSDNLASFSNFGNWITVAAPGTYIQTTNNGGGYGNWQGTSFSAPHVSALAALVFAKNPALTNSQVVNILKNNSDDLGAAGFDTTYGWGRINAFRAVQAAQGVVNLSVAITAPANNAQVSGIVTVTTSVSSSNPIARVEIYIDGALYASDSSNPYSYSWNSAGLNGQHTLFAKVFDVNGNSAASSTRTVSIGTQDSTPPDVQVTSAVSSGKTLTINASASDGQSAVIKVEFYVDGKLKATDYGAPWVAKINTKQLGAGNHVVQANGYDAAGNIGVSSSVSVTTH
jgi:subtilisin family serine protease